MAGRGLCLYLLLVLKQRSAYDDSEGDGVLTGAEIIGDTGAYSDRQSSEVSHENVVGTRSGMVFTRYDVHGWRCGHRQCGTGKS